MENCMLFSCRAAMRRGREETFFLSLVPKPPQWQEGVFLAVEVLGLESRSLKVWKK